MDLKKQIDCQEHLKCDCENISLAQFEKIKELSDQHAQLSLTCAESQKRIEGLEAEHRLNDDNIKKSCDLLHYTSEQVNETTMKIVAVDKDIAVTRDELMKLDESLNYMETCNDRHK